MLKISGYQCQKCKDIVYSRARHDMRSCSCGDIAIDGGFDYCKLNFRNIEPIKVDIVEIKLTKSDLYNDWNKSTDKYGIIKCKSESKNSKKISKSKSKKTIKS